MSAAGCSEGILRLAGRCWEKVDGVCCVFVLCILLKHLDFFSAACQTVVSVLCIC